MNRYLLFDAGCGACSGIAGQVQEEVDNILAVRSLVESEIQQHLNSTLPGWKWEPMVLEVSDDGKDIKIYAGVLMRLRLIQLLGISKAWRVATIMYRSTHVLVSLQERRRFLRYGSGVVAGLAVLGLKPVQSQLKHVLVTPNDTLTARQLTGSELDEAITEATTSPNYSKFLSSLEGRGYFEDRSQASAILVESTQNDSVLAVSLPFTGPDSNRPAQAKYLRNGSNVYLAAGIANTTDAQNPSVNVYELQSDRVRHTLTMRMEDGSLVREPVGQSTSITEPLGLPTIDEFSPDLTRCQICMGVCRIIHWAQCGSVALVACWLICLTFPPACAFICPVLIGAICNGAFGGTKCRAVCRHFNYCP
ncbi:MAG: hypothetical protein OXO50_08215 [Caldilineaceae bacterium]|nr:hypothetical protein [Caldilineaceae bacterium]